MQPKGLKKFLRVKNKQTKENKIMQSLPFMLALNSKFTTLENH